MHRLLIVDDEPPMRMALYEALRRREYDVVTTSNGSEAIERLGRERFSMVITDVKMPGMTGLDVLRSVKKLFPGLPVLMMTAFGTIENAIEAMKEGARDYILKPFSPELIDLAIKKILTSEDTSSGIVAASGRMLNILDIAKGIASTPATVLITGESGTGKELLARYIHLSSNRKDGPFVAVNCASIPDGLLESELFGHEKGAFTGALARRIGKFEAANHGTLLLDEIGEMGLQLQAKLLRVLQQREIDRLGSGAPVPVDIRVIATTNRDLKKEVSEGRFREDLFYRLNVFPINIPALRERCEDIPVLASHFLKVFAGRYGKGIKGISRAAVEGINSYRWKGNVRELQNAIERAVLLCRGEELTAEDIFSNEASESPQNVQSGLQPPIDSANSAGETIHDMEKGLIKKALHDTGGNKTKAAEKLGISVRTLRNKLKEYNGETIAPQGEDFAPPH